MRRRRDRADGTAPRPVVDHRVLLLCASRDEPSAEGWMQVLCEQGVPHTVVDTSATAITEESLRHAPGHGRYQAVIVSTAPLGAPGLADDQWDVLRAYECEFGARELTAYAVPGLEFGLGEPGWSGDMTDQTAHLTPAGREVFPDLVGPVPLSAGTWGYCADVADPLMFPRAVTPTVAVPLVETASGAALLSCSVAEDGRERMAMTVSSGPHSLHLRLLADGLLTWLTRGRRLGARELYSPSTWTTCSSASRWRRGRRRCG